MPSLSAVREIDRVALMQPRIAGPEIRIGAGEVDQLAPLIGVGIRQQAFHRHIDEGRIGIPFGEVFVGEPLGFQHRGQRIGGARAHLLQIEALQDLQHLQTLPRPDHWAAVRRRHSRDNSPKAAQPIRRDGWRNPHNADRRRCA